MSSPPRGRFWKAARRHWLLLLHDQRLQSGLLGAVLSFTLVLLALPFLRAPQLHPGIRPRERTIQPKLFIAVGSAPRNAALRRAARETWLSWLDDSVDYRFFSDQPPAAREREMDPRAKPVWDQLEEEARLTDDLVLQPLATGYGDKEHNAYGARALFQAKWAVDHLDGLEYFLRVDDDSFLCLHKLLYEIKSAPKGQFLWGRFWCREGRNRADENFLLMSADVARLLGDRRLVGGIVPYDEGVTLGWNLGYWSWVLNLTVFDDQDRLDGQQGYLTRYMHRGRLQGTGKVGDFCQTFMYAHHVQADVMREAFAATVVPMMYSLPVRKGPQDTCPRQAQSFIPARHSAKLPDLQISRSAH